MVHLIFSSTILFTSKLQIGINYSSQPNALRGCVNDARNVRDFLAKHGYHPSDILLLTDEPPKGTKEGDGWDRKMVPTREVIIRAMKWLVRGARKDDSLFFHCEFLHINVDIEILVFVVGEVADTFVFDEYRLRTWWADQRSKRR